MNIFKVLASGKQSFKEETASAILTWFLNPTMEHGLGYTFLSKFIDKICQSTNNKNILSDLSRNLTPRMRNENESQDTRLKFKLEFNVGQAFIDIIIEIEDWIFIIENKIYVQSAKKGQLVTQYEGLKELLPNAKIGMIYLVPIEEGSEMLDQKTENVFIELTVGGNDFKTVVTWQSNETEKYPSISEIIQEILEEESKGIIDPISEYTRHTLKALKSFISKNFTGYDHDRGARTSGLNPLTEKQLSVIEIRSLNNGFIGVQGGISGLLKIGETGIHKNKFQYSTQDMSTKRNWLTVATFKDIAKWILGDGIPEIDWKGNFNSEYLYKIAKDYNDKVFIGIKGGEDALRKLDNKTIKNKVWGISTEKATDQWINGGMFCRILEEKNVY